MAFKHTKRCYQTHKRKANQNKKSSVQIEI